MAKTVYVTTTQITGVNDPRFENNLIPKGQSMTEEFLKTIKDDNWKSWIERGLLEEQGVNREKNSPITPLEEIHPNDVPAGIPTVEPTKVESGDTSLRIEK